MWIGGVLVCKKLDKHDNTTRSVHVRDFSLSIENKNKHYANWSRKKEKKQQ